MSDTHTCQRGGRTFAVAAGAPGWARGAATSLWWIRLPPQTWSVSRGGSAPTKPGFAVAEFSFFSHSPASQGEELLSWGSGNTGTPTALRSAALRPLNQSPEHSPAASHTSSLKKTTLLKIRELHVRFRADAGSFLPSRPMTHQHSSPRLSSSRSSHMVFFRKRIYNTHFLARITELVDRRRRRREKNGRLGSKRGRACTVGCDSGSPGVKPQELLNVKLTRLNMIWQQD